MPSRAAELGGQLSQVAGSDSHPLPQELGAAPWEESTNDISHYLGMLDPWYERNVLGLMHLPPEVLCQVGAGRGPLAAGTQPHLQAPSLGVPLKAPLEEQGSHGVGHRGWVEAGLS